MHLRIYSRSAQEKLAQITTNRASFEEDTLPIVVATKFPLLQESVAHLESITVPVVYLT